MRGTNNSALPAFVALALGTLAATPAFAADPKGTWLTEPEVRASASRTAAARSAATSFGCVNRTMRRLVEPLLDKNNADATKRGRPLMGVTIVIGMKPSGAHEWSGQVYNAEDGKTYTGHITMQGTNALKLEGCALGGWVCKSQTWSRVN